MNSRSTPPVPRHVRHETHVHPVNADFYHVHSMNVNWDVRPVTSNVLCQGEEGRHSLG